MAEGKRGPRLQGPGPPFTCYLLRPVLSDLQRSNHAVPFKTRSSPFQAPAAETAGACSFPGGSAAGMSSSLDPLETNTRLRPSWAQRDLREPLAATRSQRALHWKHWKERERLIRVLLDSPDEQLQKRACRLDGCCQRPQLHERSDGSLAMQLRCCRDRLCPRCQRQRGLELARRVRALICGMNAPRFVTLTMRHRPENLRESHDRLQRAFRELRKMPVWRRSVTGGLAVVEITRNPATSRWHTHLHLIVDGEFLPQKQLSEAWKRCTGDSEIVDIRAVHDRARVARYVAEYVAKPQAMHTWEADAVLEFAAHMHGRRMVATFGVCHATNVDPAEKPELPAFAKYVGDIVSLVDRSAAGSKSARRACELLSQIGPQFQMAMGVTPGNATPDCRDLTASEWREVKAAFGVQMSDDFDVPPREPIPTQLMFPPPRDRFDERTSPPP